MQQQLEKIIIEGTETATQTIIWLHGYGADGYDFVPLIPQLNLRPSTRVILPSAPPRPVTINGGQPIRAWFDIRDGEISEIDREGIARSAALIDGYGEEERRQGRRLLYVGFSQGGVLALQLGTHCQCAGVVALSSFLADGENCPPATDQRPIIIMHGLYDQVIPVQRGREACAQLQQRNYPVQWFDYPMAHQVCNEQIRDLEKQLRLLDF